jgi:dephospho-CoA kinase
VSNIKKIPVISFTGGIGSGKSSVAHWLVKNRDSIIVDADKIGHEVLTLKEVKKELRNKFGDSIFDSEGEVDRLVLGRIVFGDSKDKTQALTDLEQITHPRIRTQIVDQIHRAKKTEHCQLVILDAAILLKAGWTDLCDFVIFVEVPELLRLKRVLESRNWTEENFRMREANQIPVDQKKKLANFFIKNDKSLEEAGKQVINILDNLPS